MPIDSAPRFAPTSTRERAHWRRLVAACDRGEAACHVELAQDYTRRYPLNVWGWVALGQALGRIARYDEAILALNCAKKLSRGSPDVEVFVWTELGVVHDRRGDCRRSIQCHERAVELSPDTNRLVFLGAALARKGDFAAAKRCHRKAIRVGTELPDEAYYNLGLVLRAEGHYGRAIACFDLALEHDSRDASARRARRDCARALALRKGSSVRRAP